jgi:acetyl esterase/lipase
VWSYDDNITGWGALLGEALGGPDVPAYAAPARATDLSDLPACYIEVGQLDIFRDEDLSYAQRLSRAGVNVEFHPPSRRATRVRDLRPHQRRSASLGRRPTPLTARDLAKPT